MLVQDKLGTTRCVVADPKTDLIFRGDGYKLYLASTPDGKKSGFLRLPDSRLGNADMQLEVEKLTFLKEASERIEAAYQEQQKDPNLRIHYDWLFPELVDSFVCDDHQNNRQANLISAKDADLKEFYPLPKLMSKYKVDTKTAAWILGRFFKLQTFTDEVDILFNFLSDQVVIEPRMHRMIYLGWNLHETSRDWNNVARASKCIMDFVKPDENSPEDEAFMNNLKLLASSNGMTGQQAHRTLYTMIRKYWGHKYHPFTYFDQDTATWHSLTDAEIFKP